jgi:C4-dicarboxylate-specific signal transduction histidine kinase
LAHRKDGSPFPVELGLNPIEIPRGTLVLATVTDLTSRKRAEEEVQRQREQIELLGRASLLGEMTASLAHELNQPLAAIVANASAGVRFIDGGETEPGSLREIFSDIGSDGRRARGILQSVRNAIKKGDSVRGRIGINKVVTNVAVIVRPDAAVYSCEVETSLTKNLPLVEADPIQMQQVLTNLVTNAFHAMSATPVTLRKVEVTTQLDENGSVWVKVRDHGTGISEETQERLFEHFYTTKKDGLGMGLAIVRSIVEAHGGKITAGNAEGGGACFEFRLPAVAKSRA